MEGLEDCFCLVAKGLQTVNRLFMRLSGGRTWWAHFDFTRINIGPTILRKKIEELRPVRASCSGRAGDVQIRRMRLISR